MYPNSSRSAAAQRTVAMGQQATLPISLDLTVLPQMAAMSDLTEGKVSLALIESFSKHCFNAELVQ